ncbi:DUF2953 domain-containing protein [Bacillus sp. FJAT-49705]|uniref:DUF2953 domain-containing protein n=1 Tax=Cytobacillus citreus TaxID=2833586 RepID=A0ABS5NUX0_9BACI|nr:DUF2953 domain-containing protein [Cytobacillus citreus]MBS4191626.1 DUF2953 domain-containing protein [Cytobacillus citreus]
MKWVLIALLILILLFIILIITKLKILLHYTHINDNDHLKIEFKAWFGLIKYKIEMPLIKIDEDSPTIVVKQKKGKESDSIKDTKQYSANYMLDSMHDMRELLHIVVSLNRIIKKFLRKVTIHTLEWHTTIGIGDAAYTGMLTGAFWAVKGSIVGVVSHFMRLKSFPDITITPQFQVAVSQTTISCMIYFRIGHAMFAGIKLMKYWKGGRARFRTKPLAALSNNKTKSV